MFTITHFNEHIHKFAISYRVIFKKRSMKKMFKMNLFMTGDICYGNFVRVDITLELLYVKAE